MTREQIEKRFTYHPPQGDQAQKYQEIRDTAKSFALRLRELCIDNREFATALTKLDEVVFFANASIARDDYSAIARSSVGESPESST